MVCGTVFAYQPCAVEAEHHVKIQQGHIMDDVVEGTLCKGTVDITERQKSVFGHTAREGNSVPLGYSYVEGSFWHFCHHDVHRTAAGHGGRYTHDFRILLGKFQQGMSKHILIFLRFRGVVVHKAFARVRIELAGSMPYGNVFFCGRITMSFLRVQMEQLWTLHILHLA